MKLWSDYQDSKGFVTQKQSLGGDAGDSLNRTCAAEILSLLCWMQGSPPDCSIGRIDWAPLTNGNGKWRRSWQEPKWYADWDRASRDQLTPLVITLGLFGNKDLLWATFKDHCKRGLLFTTNTRRNYVYPTKALQEQYGNPVDKWDYSWKCPDITGPEFWSLYVRGFASPWFYLLLCLFDVHTLIGSIVIRFNSDTDVINHALILEYAEVRLDTWPMKLARMITPRSLLQERLDRFFGVEIEPGLNELYRSLK